MIWKIIGILFVFYWNIIEVKLEPGDKSIRKCAEYGQYVYQVENSPVLLRKNVENRVSQCGIVEVPLVIGGVAAAPKEFPHMAVVGYGSGADLKWKCGGSLISEMFVLTAAHCLKSSSDLPTVVRVGEVDFETETESEIQDKLIVKTIQHPEYKPPSKYNDIALLKSNSNVDFNAFVRPACLNAEPLDNPSSVIASGFGKTSFDASEGSKKLMKVNLRMIDPVKCITYFNTEVAHGDLKHGLVSTQFCAGELAGGKDTCQGDSGGPIQLVRTEPYCMYDIIGVVSFGKFCGFANQPAIYTNVASYIGWIETIVW